MKNKEKFRKFFEINRDWINSHSLLIADNLKIFYQLFYDYIFENGLEEDQGINVFRIVIKQEILKSIQLDSQKILFNSRKNIMIGDIIIDNPIIRKWYSQCIQEDYMQEKKRQLVRANLISLKMKDNCE